MKELGLCLPSLPSLGCVFWGWLTVRHDIMGASVRDWIASGSHAGAESLALYRGSVAQSRNSRQLFMST